MAMKSNIWIKATRSNGNGGNNCVETLQFFKATKSNPSGNCVEAAFFKAGKSGPNCDNCVEVSFAAADKSTPSGACVEVGFEASSKSGPAGHCVEVGTAESTSNGEDVNWARPGDCGCGAPVMNGKKIVMNEGDVVIRDSKQNGAENQKVIVMSKDAWQEYLRGLKLGFGAIYVNRANSVLPHDDNPWKIVGQYEGKTVVLEYNDAEWDAFMDGVHKGEFDPADEAISNADLEVAMQGTDGELVKVAGISA